MVTKVSEVKDIVKNGIANPQKTFPEIRKMAENNDWKVREVAATILVEISKKKPSEIIKEMIRWTYDNDSNIRRTASEGLRHLARRNPADVLPVIEKLKKDSNLYVKKSVANIMRNAGKNNPELVLNLCRKWAALKNPNINWIIKDGLRKLKESCHGEVEEILNITGNEDGK